jgi:hypothetical protein
MKEFFFRLAVDMRLSNPDIADGIATFEHPPLPVTGCRYSFVMLSSAVLHPGMFPGVKFPPGNLKSPEILPSVPTRTAKG